MKCQATKQAVQDAQCLIYATLGLIFCRCAKIPPGMSDEVLAQVKKYGITCSSCFTTDTLKVKYGLTRGP